MYTWKAPILSMLRGRVPRSSQAHGLPDINPDIRKDIQKQTYNLDQKVVFLLDLVLEDLSVFHAG